MKKIHHVFMVSMQPGAKAARGRALEAPYSFKVLTESGLAVADVSPRPNAQDVGRDARIVVSFNRPVVPLMVAFALGPHRPWQQG